MWTQYLRRLYSLDTLDTRFTISANTPPRDTAIELRQDPARPSPRESGQDATSAQNGLSQGAQPSKWNTWEFYFYYVVFIVAVPNMFKAVYDVSQESSPNYSKYSHLLSDGWIPGRKVDNSDAQYASFRDNIPYVAVVLVLHLLLRKVYDAFYRIDTYTQTRPAASLGTSNSNLNQGLSTQAAADARMEHRISFDLGFAMIFLVALHGISSLKVLGILFINYKLATRLPRAYVPSAAWIFNIGVLFANELSEGYRLAKLSTFIVPAAAGSGEISSTQAWAHWADGFGGLISRWEVLFNITVLRLISFDLDFYWSINIRGGSPIEKQLDPSNLSERDRVSIPARPSDFSFRNYLAYALYSPLYLTGPILTFNDYISQSRYRSPTITTQRTFLYAIRFALCLLAMELIIHYIYAVAISKAQPDWEVYTPAQLSMLGYFNLHHIWLKLLLPWRFFRLWALLDGVDPPENMVRCMSDNYSALAFWRGWHRSFNRWVVRYIYIPLGGGGGPDVKSKGGNGGLWAKFRGVANVLVVFTFVALWHDIQLRLLVWGWLITLFVLPEVIATIAFPARKWRARPTAHRIICGIGAVANILMMMAANLVGFAVGFDGLKGLVNGIVGSKEGLGFLAAACGALFVGVQVMFEVREGEKRKGIKMKC
ncbi:glycerol:H+ symporter [Lineolata rhizophorae]|uniref:Glycerol:H+ symporter n=1 Tax=Lineolata rhizophorae TaxID=578093 RepID=A0A6A6P6N0_9PEZI|nr:glycerol:H+ symporter [Lineolata rhizophorae]